MDVVLNEEYHQVRWLTINRPERRNALDRDTIYALKAALAESAGDDTRLVVLTGAGGAFSSGADLLAGSLTSDNSRGRTDRGRL